MSTVIKKYGVVEYDGIEKVSLDKLFVTIHYGEDSTLQDVSLDKLFVKQGKKARKIRSYSDFINQLYKDNVFTSENLQQSIRYGLSEEIKVKVQTVDIPNQFDSTRINKDNSKPEELVPYGLKRNLKVKVADSSVAKEDRYYLVEINGKNDFFKLSSIYFYDKSNRKRLLSDYKGDITELSDIQLYAEDGSKISMIYTEKQFVFPQINAKETVDFAKQEKTTYEQIAGNDNNGVEFKYSTQKVDKYYSEQQYVKKIVDDEKNPGKIKEISLIQVRNFEYQPGGEYYQLIINGHKRMVKLENIVDEDGLRIRDMSKMLGKVVYIQENGQIIAKTETLIYEQANMTYSTIKTYQESENSVNENSYLRLKNGQYIKELENVKPISYTVVNSDNDQFDAYLAKIVADDGTERFEVVSKDYFDKHGDSAKYKRANVIRIQRCDFNSDKCDVVQTTSKGAEVEQCVLVRNIKFSNTEVNDDAKEVAYGGFLAGYRSGVYLVKDVYHNGKLEELSPRKQRYEYSEISYLTDYADNMHQYKSLKDGEMRIVNGKIVGGPKFKIGKSIKNSYSTLFKGFSAAFLPVMFGGILTASIGGPVFAAAFVGAAVAAIPVIPIANVVYGTIKNHNRTRFASKEKKNRRATLKDLEKRMKKLYERQVSKDYIPLPEARFEYEYSKLVNDIISLSSCSIANELHFENGVAKVTPENANAAKRYISEFNHVSKKLEKSNDKLDSAKRNFEKLDVKMKKLEAEGKVVKSRFQKKYDKAKLKYAEAKNVRAQLVARKEALMNDHGDPLEMSTHSERDKLLKQASEMRTAVYFQTFKDSEIIQEAIYGEKGLENTANLETEVGLDVEDATSTQPDKDIYRQNHIDKTKKMLNNINMDFNKGLMIDGKSADLNNDKKSIDSKNEDKQWLQVKRAVEYVHNTLNPQVVEISNEDTGVDNFIEPSENNNVEVQPVEQKKTKNKTIAREHDVVLALEEEGSDLYKFVISKLTRKNGKYVMSKEEATKFIFEFTQKIKAAHDEGVPAQTKFEKGSIEEDILKSSIKKMAVLITQNQEIS